MQVTVKEFGMDAEQIFYNLDPVVAKAITISDSGVVANAEGRKIVPNGSIINPEGVIVDDDTARFIVLHDTDVTGGPISGTGVYRGTCYYEKLPVAPTADVMAAIKGVTFMNNDSEY